MAVGQNFTDIFTSYIREKLRILTSKCE